MADERNRSTRQTFSPGPTPSTVRAADGTILNAPDGWALLPPGDAGLTRRVKEAGDHWAVQEKKGRKTWRAARHNDCRHRSGQACHSRHEKCGAFQRYLGQRCRSVGPMTVPPP